MLTIWCNSRLPTEAETRLTQSVAPNQILFTPQRTANLSASHADPLLNEADIAYGQPDPDQLLTLSRLRWLHLSSAGYTRYDRADLRESFTRRGVIMTTSSSVFDEPCAQHVLAFMLAGARNLPASIANQLGPRAWPIADFRDRCRLLTGQTALLLGFGAISRRLAELLAPLRMNVIAIRQKPRGDEPIPIHPVSSLESLLPHADHVIDALPSSPTTDGFMNSARIAAMKSGAIFYNIGRGTTVDHDALARALTTGKLAAAFLDVTLPEPLPPDHPVWKTPNCHITPHIGGGHADEFERNVDHFLANLRLFQTSAPLRDRIV